MKTAKPSVAPITMPSSRSAGCASGAGGGDCGATGAAASAGGGGRRDGRKIRRARVAVNDARGITQSGFPLIDGSDMSDMLVGRDAERAGLLVARQRPMMPALVTAVAIWIAQRRVIICCPPKAPRPTT